MVVYFYKNRLCYSESTLSCAKMMLLIIKTFLLVSINKVTLKEIVQRYNKLREREKNNVGVNESVFAKDKQQR